MKTIGWLLIVVIAIATLVAGLAFPSSAHGSGYLWDYIPGFYILFGFAGGVLLAAFAKFIGKLVVLKKEDYYNEH